MKVKNHIQKSKIVKCFLNVCSIYSTYPVYFSCIFFRGKSEGVRGLEHDA